MKVMNQKTIRHLSFQAWKAAGGKNVIAVLAVALTTLLFTALFTVVFSVNDVYQEDQFKSIGGWVHGSYKHLTIEQAEQLRKDPLIRESGLERYIGSIEADDSFFFLPEVCYCDENMAKWMYSLPTEGSLPREGTLEAAVNVELLKKLGVEPRLGVEFELTVEAAGEKWTKTLVLSGFWEKESETMVDRVLISRSLAEQIVQEMGIEGTQSVDGTWQLGVMFSNSFQLENKMQKVLHRQGYQSSDETADNYIHAGYNYGYSGSAFLNNMDVATALAVSMLLLIIFISGYLIIYNIFQISVSQDIRFYGLLKTIGTTAGQIEKMVRYQAYLLSGIGILIGMLLGYGMGAVVVPFVFQQFIMGMEGRVSFRPEIFVGAALFSLVTVIISCRKPVKMAAKVSPVEAVRYTENTVEKRREKKQKRAGSVSIPKMALSQLGRKPKKTILTLFSIALAIVLFEITVMGVKGFDVETFLWRMPVDYICGNKEYFNIYTLCREEEIVIPVSLQEFLKEQEGVTDGGAMYVPENRKIYPEGEEYEENFHFARLWGADSFILDHLPVYAGDIERVKTEENCIAVIWQNDGMENIKNYHGWIQPGDKITLRNVLKTGWYSKTAKQFITIEEVRKKREEIDAMGLSEEETQKRYAKEFWLTETEYEDKEYEVGAIVGVPFAFARQGYDSDTDLFLTNASQYFKDSAYDENSAMFYAFNVEEGQEEAMSDFLEDLFLDGEFMYESKETYLEQIQTFRQSFLILGTGLSILLGMIGILNFIHVELTEILARKREFAVMQAVGMTGRQLKQMLIWEGLLYASFSVIVAGILSCCILPFLLSALDHAIWFFNGKFTLLPITGVMPVLLFFGIIVPIITYHFMAKHTLVDRLREAEL